MAGAGVLGAFPAGGLDAAHACYGVKVGQFDVVHCSSVFYHTPDPVNAIRNLISITREPFLLSSAVVPNVISNRVGKLALRAGECLLVPALDERDRAVLREYCLKSSRLPGSPARPATP